MEKQIKKLIWFVLFIFPKMVLADPFELPQRFSPGDVLSSDVLNDIFDRIGVDQMELDSDEIIGEWLCTAYATPYAAQSAVNGWSVDSSGIYYQLSEAEIVFSKSGDVYQYSTNAPNPFFPSGTDASSGSYVVSSNLLYFKTPSDDELAFVFEIKRMGNSRMMLYSPPTFPNTQSILFCDLQNLPPENPKQLSATLSDSTVSLTWSDESDDETGFKILRRDSLTGEFAEIGTASADATSYTDTLTSDGKYWYRVVAVNENGDSLGSNVVKVTLGDEDDTQSLRNELRMMRERMQLIEDELGESEGRP